MSTKFYIGLDLGQMSDFTAITVLERRRCQITPGPALSKRGHLFAHPTEVDVEEYHLRHVERLPLGTPYTRVAERVKELQERAPLAGATRAVVVDTTGVGLPVFEMLQVAGVQGLVGVCIHGGDSVSRSGRIYRVPKRDLVSSVQVLLQTGKLKIAVGLDGADILRRELLSFTAKISFRTGHDGYEAWREGDHDDLVLSLALACWFAESLEPEDTPLKYAIVKG